MAESQNLNTYILSRNVPYGDPWIGEIISYSDGSTPLTSYTPDTSKALSITSIDVKTPSGFSVNSGGELRIFWGSKPNERITFSDIDEIKTQCTVIKDSENYSFRFFPQAGSSPIQIKSSESQSISVGCYSSGGSVDESASLAQTIKISIRGVTLSEANLV